MEESSFTVTSHAATEESKGWLGSFLSKSNGSVGMSSNEGGAVSHRQADGPSQHDGASRRRKAVRDMSEGLLNSISVRVAHSINMALAPGAEPLFRAQSNLVLPRFSQSSKSPHYDLPAESRNLRRGERRVLFPLTSGASLTRGLAGAVDLTEPLFEDPSQDSDRLQFNSFMQPDSFGSSVKGAGKRSEPVYDINNNIVELNNSSEMLSCDAAGYNATTTEDEDLLELAESSNAEHVCFDESGNGVLGTEIMRKEPKPCPSTAFELFNFKVLPLLRMSEEEATCAIKTSWDQLPATEKYAFEMQRFALKDSYKKELLAFVDTMPEPLRKIYLRLRRTRHTIFFGFDIYKNYGSDYTECEAYPMDYFCDMMVKSPIRNSNVGKNRVSRYSVSDAYSFDASLIPTQQTGDTAQNLSAFSRNSCGHYIDINNNAGSSLSDPATSFSSASNSWEADEDPYDFEELSFVESVDSQDYDSDSNCDSSQTSTVTSVVMRPARN